MTAHTPGPWKAALADEKAIKWYITANIPGMQNSETEIAVVYGGKAGEKSEKNSMLIASAPDLLAACKAYLAAINDRGIDEAARASEQIAAAVAKAEGQGVRETP